MTGTLLLALFAGLVLIGVVVAVAVMRRSGPRPDAPLKGMDADHDPQQSNDRTSRTRDRPGGPGQEPEHPFTGDASPGTMDEDSR